MKPGEGFERLAGKIYAELSPTATVRTNDHIVGLDSGIERQIDVSIRHDIAGHSILVIVDTKDYSRPVDITEVEQFAAVVRDVRANRGVLICKSGFTSTALPYAQRLGIDLCNLHDAESRDWNLDIRLPILWFELTPDVAINLEHPIKRGDRLVEKPADLVITDDAGATGIDLLGTFERMWNHREIPQEVGEHVLEHDDLSKTHVLVFDADGKPAWRPVRKLAIRYVVNQSAWLGWLTPNECRGVKHYADNRFVLSHLDASFELKRDEAWPSIDKPEELSIAVPACVVVTMKPEVKGEYVDATVTIRPRTQ